MLLGCTLSAGAWDFCLPNDDGVMLYYNFIEYDDEACELTYSPDAHYYEDTIRIPGQLVLNRGDRGAGAPDTLLTVIGIGDDAFHKCRVAEMKCVELPYGLGYIGDRAFRNCPSLQAIVWPENNEWFYSIGKEAFSNCAELADAMIPKTTEELGEGAFSNTGLTSLDFEPGNPYITTIPRYCFRDCGRLTDVRIPSFIKSIGTAAFAENTYMQAPRMPRGLLVIGDSAFYNHGQSWNSLEIPATVTEIGEHAFSTYFSFWSSFMNISNLYVNAIEPPYCVSTRSLGGNYYDTKTMRYTPTILNITLIVPRFTREIYTSTYPWTRFPANMVIERSVAGLSPVTVVEQEAESIFSSEGRQLGSEQKGINIIRYRDGSVHKVYRR